MVLERSHYCELFLVAITTGSEGNRKRPGSFMEQITGQTTEGEYAPTGYSGRTPGTPVEYSSLGRLNVQLIWTQKLDTGRD